MTEIWKPVVGHEGAYEVSDLGRVRSLSRCIKRTRNGKCEEVLRKGRVLRPDECHGGHLQVTLSGRKKRPVHQLVAEAFLGLKPEGCRVLHRDGNPANNCVYNLYWGRFGESNTRTAARLFYQKGRELSREQVLLLRERAAAGFAYGERHQLAVSWGVDPSIVYQTLAGKLYGHVA